MPKAISLHTANTTSWALESKFAWYASTNSLNPPASRARPQNQCPIGLTASKGNESVALTSTLANSCSSLTLASNSVSPGLQNFATCSARSRPPPCPARAEASKRCTPHPPALGWAGLGSPRQTIGMFCQMLPNGGGQESGIVGQKALAVDQCWNMASTSSG
ncbi:hypothetical protein BASA81_008333 [Batrachochytrium salamandrivorans]|nr:hypothetical protein BASA81_008333 [Batrachochytrium salamandrivorans]